METKTQYMHPTPIENTGHKPDEFDKLYWKMTAAGGIARDVHILGIRTSYIDLHQLEKLVDGLNVKLHQIGDQLEVIVAGKQHTIDIAKKLNPHIPHIGIVPFDKEYSSSAYIKLEIAINEAEKEGKPYSYKTSIIPSCLDG